MQDFSSSWQIRVPAWRARAKVDRPSHWAESPQRSLATERLVVSGLSRRWQWR